MRNDLNKYNEQYTIRDVILCILFDVILFVSSLPACVMIFCEEWQEDLVYMMYSNYRISFLPYWQFFLLLALLFLVKSGVNIFLKLIGGACLVGILQWVTATEIPSKRLEAMLLSPLKEQCYSLLQTIPFIAVWLCILLGLLIIVFHHNKDLKIVLTNANSIVAYVILGLNFCIIPYILRPLITVWL